VITKIRIRNFKQFEDSGDIELGQTVVFVGPNNSGKTTVLQALTLWYAGIREWNTYVDSHISPSAPNMEPPDETTINRYHLTAIPVSNVALLWRNMQVRNGAPLELEIAVSGITRNQTWEHNLKFVYANEESLTCELGDKQDPLFEPTQRIVYVPSIAGLLQDEPLWQPGRINVLVGQGQTGQILRNVCYHLFETNGKNGNWEKLTAHIKTLFQVELLPPEYNPANDQFRFRYQTPDGLRLDLTSSGRGMHQVMLLLAYMYSNANAVLLIDEPDAHLEIIRQREIYRLLKEVAQQQAVQLIVTTHSEVVMEEAAGQDIAIALVGAPHRIDHRNKSQIEKALKHIPAVDYYQAERKGWVLYLEGSTDLAILQRFAETLKHPAQAVLTNAYVHYINNNEPKDAEHHFYGLREAKPDLVAIALFDRVSANKLRSEKGLTKICWRKREIENYLCMPETLLAYASEHQAVMQYEVERLVNALQTLKRPSPWSADLRVSEEFLEPLFENYYEKLGLPNLMRKTNFHVLAQYLPANKIDPEVTEKLDAIVEVAKRATPRED
jgi:predicted ATPase